MEECPRCGEPTEGFRALSRTCDDDDVFVCADCGSDEAFEAHAGKLRPRSEWVMIRLGH